MKLKKSCKIIAFCLVFAMIFSLAGCEKTKIEDCLSEKVELYFVGSDNKSSVSVGQREEPYLMNGKSEGLCSFSLVTFQCDYVGEDIEVSIFRDETETKETMFYNHLNGLYMCDLEQKIKKTEKISLIYGEKTIYYSFYSDNLISEQNALKISKEALKNEIDSLYDGSSFNVECYLRILQNDDEFFWYFAIYSSEKLECKVLIDAKTSEILAK